MSPAAPLARLARYRQGAFEPLTPGELTEPAVHVFVHGWQPGYRLRERLLATTDGVSVLPAWDPRLVDASGRALISDYTDLLDALTGLGPAHAVLWYSWLDESATDADVFQAFRSRQATQVNGRRLAAALQLAMGAHRGRVHLLGHSHGGAVVTHAAVAMVHRPEHLTLLDVPEDPISRAGGASDLIAAVLPRLHPGRGPHRSFVDSYVTVFGRPYHHRAGLHEVVDVQLTAPLVRTRDPRRALNAAHLYPVQWYARSVRERQQGVGYGWSPLTGADTAPLHPWYAAALPQRPLLVSRHVGDPFHRLAERVDRAMVRCARGDLGVPRRAVEDITLGVDGDGAAAGIVVTDRGDELLEFDLLVRGGSGEEEITLELDGAPAFLALAGYRVPRAGRYLLLTDALPGEHLLTLRVAGAGAASRVEVVNLWLVRGGRGSGFSVARSAGVLFAAGAAAGAGTALVGLLVAHRARQLGRPQARPGALRVSRGRGGGR